MRRVLVLAVLVSLAGPAAAASTFLTEATDFTSEPDTAEDANGIPAARAGAPARILNSKWINDAPANTFGAAQVDLSRLLAPFGGPFIVPLAPGEFHAWYGDWVDGDGDGHLASPEAQYVGAGVSGRSCADAGPAPALVLGDCAAGEREWSPVGGAGLFSYLTPGRATDSVNVLARDPGPRDPSFGYASFAFPEGLRYYAPSSNFAFFFVDDSMLQATTVETYANPLPTDAGPRSLAPVAGEPLDVDRYHAVDPTVEALYASLVTAPLAALGCEAERPWESATADGDCVADLPDLPPLGGVVGPFVTPVRPRIVNEETGHDHATGAHVYFDVHLDLAGYQPFIVAGGDGSLGATSSDASGVAKAPVLAGVYGRLGLWYDANADGRIGSALDDCETDADCLLTGDANTYTSDEWTPFCRQTTEPVGEIRLALASTTGAWGASGVYVLTDRSVFGLGLVFPGQGFDDWYYFPGNPAIASSPYDDMVLDLADGDVDMLVTRGTIPMHINCDAGNAPGMYRSYEHLLFPEGGNRGYGIRLVTEAYVQPATLAGLEQAEVVHDEDLVPAL